MSEHQLRFIKFKVAAVVLYVAGAVAAILQATPA